MQDFGDAFEFVGSTTPDDDEAFEEYSRLVQRGTLKEAPTNWNEVYTIADQQTDPGVLLLMLRKLRPADAKHVDTHLPLARHLCQLYSKLVTAPPPLPAFTAPPAPVQADWPAFLQALLKTDDPGSIAALPAAMLPADTDVQAQAAAFVAERNRSLTGQVESRMLNGTSALGLELQDLNSFIAEVPDLAVVDPWLAGLVTTVPTVLCGDALLWKAIGDGTNLEFVTEPTNNRHVLTQVLTEVCAVHALLRTATPGLYRVGGRVIGIVNAKSVSDGAQPQFNVDMPLARIVPALLQFELALDEDAEVGHAQAASDRRYTWLFGVQSKLWSAKKIDEEMGAVVRAARAIADLPEKAFASLVPPGIRASANLDQIRGYLLLMAMCANHRIFYDNVDLPKDMPLLPKTNLADLTRQLCDVGYLAADPRKAAADVLAFLDKSDLIAGRSRKPTWYHARIRLMAERMSAGNHPLERVDGLTPAVRDDRFSVVLEFRRVGILPAGQWVTGAQRAFDEFVADPDRRYG